MIRDIEDISKIRKTKLRLHKKPTMRGLYYRSMMKKIANPNWAKMNSIKIKSATEKENKSHEAPVTQEGSLFDRLC